MRIQKDKGRRAQGMDITCLDKLLYVLHSVIQTLYMNF